MSEQQTIKVLKICILIGICLLLLGHYLISYTNITQSMGIAGMILSAACVALGLIFSLPTKMYLTFLLVTRENRRNHPSDKQEK
ncbi:hypothetical protein DXX93_06580 [Thalassotalea euphylliae]|uniref:Uncharacterized protein n=1 Tax=Thalassotalea euphylliae TaxID=1655234 RepID=A0A3E0TNU0_9GAMM|nr:hypothetical protein [Thalassotalea euphylliae]REL26281.1 hypothetical protein DXX93_06580 [Thalassotalea euphylliae]